MQPSGMQTYLDADPTVNRMTDMCKNITLPQTSFAGAQKEESTKTKIKQDILVSGAPSPIPSPKKTLDYSNLFSQTNKISYVGPYSLPTIWGQKH